MSDALEAARSVEEEIAAIRGLTGQQLHQLLMNLEESDTEQLKKGAGKAMTYIKGWVVRRNLIRIFGFGNFSIEVLEGKILHVEKFTRPPRNGKEASEGIRAVAQCTTRLTIHATGAVYTGISISSQTGNDYGDVAEFAMKTADTDSLKRAASNLGTQFGLSLYDDGYLGDIVQWLANDGQVDALAKHREKLRLEWEAHQRQVAAQQQPQSGAQRPTQTPGALPGTPQAAQAAGEAQSALAGGFDHPDARQ